MIQMTREEYEKKYGKKPDVATSSQNGTTPRITDYVRSGETGRKSIENNPYGASFPSTGKENPLQAGAMSLGNVPSSAFNLAKGVFGAITNPIDTAKGLFSAVKGTGESAGRGLLQAAGVQNLPEKSVDEQTANAIGQYFVKRYGSLEDAQKTATDDPLGFGSDILSVITGGAGAVGKAGAVLNTATKATRPVATAVVKTASGIKSGVADVASGAMGITTGAGKETFKQALSGSPEFTAGMRGSANAADVLNEAKQGLSQVKATRSVEYNKAMDDLAMQNTQSFDMGPIFTKQRELAAQFGIKKTADGWDFSRSSLVDDEPKVRALFDLLDEWGTQGGDRSIRGIDELKQRIRQFRQPTNPTLTAFVDDLARSTQGVIKDVKGYKEIQDRYGAYSDFIDELERTLSLSESATPDQAITKLNSLLRDNSDYRRILIEEFKQATGKDILASVAGQAASKAVPQGAAKIFAGGIGISMPHLIPALAFSSPRLMAEFFNLVGATNRTVGGILTAINEFRVPEGLPKIKIKQ